jgi:hypothetical protein
MAGSSSLRSTFVSFLIAWILLFTGYLIHRNWLKAALISTILLVLLYSYGHVYILLKGINFNGVYPFRHRIMMPVWILAFALSALWVARKSINLGGATYLLNVMGLFLLIFPSFELINYGVQRQISKHDEAGDPEILELRPGESPPDIYYIILDGYGRSDVLLDEFGYDNSGFLDDLKGIGFYVADCSQSNYAQTQLSLASSLNFDYLETLGEHFTPDTSQRTGLDEMIQHNAVRSNLEAAGYLTAAFATGFRVTELTDADYFLSPQYTLGELNEFEYLLLETTFARVIQDIKTRNYSAGSERYRERTLFALDKLDKLNYIKAPKFVFVHLIIPHPPYVFGPTGDPVAPSDVGTPKSEQNKSHYIDQVIYVNRRLLEIIPRIIENSSTPPVIIIQGDHGPTIPSSSQQRMKNLSAYYLPGVNASLYPTITPVNTFRVIFNAYFGQHLDLLDDVSLYSTYDEPFRYSLIPNLCRTNQ